MKLRIAQESGHPWYLPRSWNIGPLFRKYRRCIAFGPFLISW